VTRLCVDTADLDAIAAHHPDDATTNPTLLLHAAQSSAVYERLAEEALYSGLCEDSPRDRLSAAGDALAVLAGREILGLIPGRVSTETDARLAFDAGATVEHALSLMQMYQRVGVPRSRVLIKIAATWEGMQAVRTLQSVHGIACNCTLVFSISQAAACADAGAAVISPFVGRISDWHREHALATQPGSAPAASDPGVAVVHGIFHYVKAWAPHVTVMGASFRTPAQVCQLAGIDEATLSPTLLQQLAVPSHRPLTRVLGPPQCTRHGEGDMAMPEALHPVHSKLEWEARLGVGMARDKLEEGVVRFARDAEALELWLGSVLRP
jgi:transaldolase